MSQNITKILEKYVILYLKDYKIIYHHGLTFIPKFVEEEDRSQNLDLNKFKKPSNNSNYTNPNLDGIIKGNVINIPFYSISS